MRWSKITGPEGELLGWQREDGLELFEENHGVAPAIPQPRRDRAGHAWVWALVKAGKTLGYFRSAAAGKRAAL